MRCSAASTATRATTARRASRGRTSITSPTSCGVSPEAGPPNASSGSRWSRNHEPGWTTRTYRRKLGCTVAMDPTHGYDMTIGGFWVEGEPDGEPGRWDVVGTSEARLLLPWNQ